MRSKKTKQQEKHENCIIKKMQIYYIFLLDEMQKQFFPLKTPFTPLFP